MDIARLGIRLTRQAVEDAGPNGRCAVAFSVNGDVDSAERTVDAAPPPRPRGGSPDLLLMETMSLIRNGLTYEAVELAVDSGIPVWLAFAAAGTASAGVRTALGGPRG